MRGCPDAVLSVRFGRQIGDGAIFRSFPRRLPEESSRAHSGLRSIHRDVDPDITYLHGAVQRPSSRLVLTDRDFGQAYLADGWATRFLMEMFREFTVLFVGYSHQDLVMCYLVDADAASDAPGDIVCDCITMGRRASRA